MSFQPLNFASVAKFNSATSSEFLSFYQDYVLQKLREDSLKPKNKTFAPSSFRCARKCWFRLRGVETDMLTNPDPVLNFKAEVGTARHEIIQSNLKEALGDDWIEVPDYLSKHPIPYEYTLTQKNLETLIEISDPPIRFACDGIIRWKDKIYLLEIKTADYDSWNSLTDWKAVHKDQIQCYSTLLGLPHVIVIYEDRQYGDLKFYEEFVNQLESQAVLDRMHYIQEMVECNLAPDRVPNGDYMCNNCEYRVKCKQWG